MRLRVTRVRVYGLLVVLAGLIWFGLNRLYPDTWACDGTAVCRTTASEDFSRAATMTGIVAVLLVAFELSYRLWMRRRQGRYGDAPQEFGPLPVPARIVVHLTGVAIIVLVAFSLGTRHFERVNCTGPDFGGECDLAGLEGTVWAGFALIGATATAILIEIYLARRRRLGRQPTATEVPVP